MSIEPNDLTKSDAPKRRKFANGNLALVAPVGRKTEFQQLIDEWLEACEANDLSPVTLAGYKDKVSKFFWWWDVHTKYGKTLGDHPRFVTKKEVRQYAIYLKSPARDRWGISSRRPVAKLTPASIASYARPVIVFFNWLETEDYIDATPFTKGIKFGVKHQAEELVKVVSEGDLKNILAYLMDKDRLELFCGVRDFAIIALLIDTGIRRGELLNIKVKDVDLHENQVIVHGKGPQRKVPFSPYCKEALKAYLKSRDEVLLPFDDLWITDRNKPLGYDGFASIIRRLKAGTGVNFHAHQLRHTFATLCVKMGVDISNLSRLLGHTKIYTTQIYVHQNSSMLAEIHKAASPLKHLEESGVPLKKSVGRPRRPK